MKKHAIIPIFIPHIGCSESCVFCDQKQITARSKAPTVDEVRTTIDTWLSTLNAESSSIEIAFYGGSFTAIPVSMQERYLSVAKEYIDRGLVSSLHLSTRPDCITPEILEMLSSYGVRTIELGVQSFDDGVLSKCKRGHDAETVRRACQMIKEFRLPAINNGQPSMHAEDTVYIETAASDNAVSDNAVSDNAVSDNAVSDNTVLDNAVLDNAVLDNAVSDNAVSDNTFSDNGAFDIATSNIASSGFKLGIQLMVGLPGDSMDACIYSAKEAVKLDPDLARIYPTLVLEGTELMEMYRMGEYTPLTREEAITRSKAMYEILDAAGIYIMRVGLKSTDIINSENLGEINSGAYHPAFRQLVEGRIARDRIDALINCQPAKEPLHPSSQPDEESSQPYSQPAEESSQTYSQHAEESSQTYSQPAEELCSLTVLCSKNWISNAAGHCGENRKYFIDKYPCLDLHFDVDPSLAPGEFRIVSNH